MLVLLKTELFIKIVNFKVTYVVQKELGGKLKSVNDNENIIAFTKNKCNNYGYEI